MSMNRRAFIKRASATVLALALPNVPASLPLKDEGGFTIPKPVGDKILDIVKGTLYIQRKGKDGEWIKLADGADFKLHENGMLELADMQHDTEISFQYTKKVEGTCSFSLDEMNQENFKKLFLGDFNDTSRS